MKRAVGMVLFWILGTISIWMAFYAFRSLFRDMAFHTLDSTDVSAFLAVLFGIPAYYVWRFMIR
jgi:hypothetical protein